MSSLLNLPLDTPWRASGDAQRGEHQDRPVAERDPPRGRFAQHRHLRGRPGTRLGAVASDVQEQLGRSGFLGYHAELLGEYKERQDAQSDMILYGIAAAIGIFLLLQASFRSWRLAVLSFVTLPMSLISDLLAVVIGADGILSIGSLVGFLTVFGIAARNKIMLINHYQHLEKVEGEVFGPHLVSAAPSSGSRHLDDDAGNRPGPRAARDLRQHSGTRDRVPDGDRHLGWHGHLTLLNLFVVPVTYLRFARGINAPADEPAAATA